MPLGCSRVRRQHLPHLPGPPLTPHSSLLSPHPPPCGQDTPRRTSARAPSAPHAWRPVDSHTKPFPDPNQPLSFLFSRSSFLSPLSSLLSPRPLHPHAGKMPALPVAPIPSQAGTHRQPHESNLATNQPPLFPRSSFLFSLPTLLAPSTPMRARCPRSQWPQSPRKRGPTDSHTKPIRAPTNPSRSSFLFSLPSFLRPPALPVLSPRSVGR